MTRHFNSSRQRSSSHCIAPAPGTRTSPVDATQCFDATAILCHVFQTLPVPAPLLDRTGTLQVANAEASTLLGPSAIGDHLGHCFVADRAGASPADHGTTMASSGGVPVATYLSGWLRLADFHWVATRLRLESAPGLRHEHSDADVIAPVQLQPQPALEIVLAGSNVN